MTRHAADRPRTAGKGRLHRFLAVARASAEGPHPAIAGAMRQGRATPGARRMVEFLRIARGRLT